MTIRAEIIAIGDELTTGQRLDTNSQWLAERLLEVGVPVAFHTTVGDTLADNVLVFRQACERAEVVVASGGLGPTADDLTRHALAELAGVPLVQDDASLAHIKALFARRKREMPPANVIQAQFPQGATPIHNPHGTAPGIDISIPRAVGKPTRIFCLPGVPAEMKEMWAATVSPAIQSLLGVKRVIAHYRLKCFGVGESDLEAMLPDLIARDRYPLVGITVHQATITLRITAAGETPTAARAAMEPTIQTIRECLGDLIFGEEDDELQDVVCRNLRRRRETLAVVEWGTAGTINKWLSSSRDAERAFEGGVVLSNHVAAQAMTGASCESGIDQGFCSPWFAKELAQSGRERFGTDWVLAIGPLPQPAHEQFVYLAIAAKDGAATKAVPFVGHPSILVDRTAKTALDWLRKRVVPPTSP
jgi:nicotinamide-nucleotide amidase